GRNRATAFQAGHSNRPPASSFSFRERAGFGARARPVSRVARARGWLVDRSQAAKPSGRSTEAIAIVIDQSMLGNQAAFELVELGGFSRGDEKRFQDRDLAVFVEIGFIGGRDGFGKILAETGEILFVAAAGGGNDDSIRRRQLVQERRAGGSGIDDDDGPVKGFQPDVEIACGDIRSAEIEARLLAIESAMADEDNPKFGWTFLRFLFEGA